MTGFFMCLELFYTVIFCLLQGGISIRFDIQKNSPMPIYEQIANQVKEQILHGELKENDALPSVRSLAKDLQISALTIKKSL
jgi:hypothetical protein